MGNHGGRFMALDAATGELRWELRTGRNTDLSHEDIRDFFASRGYDVVDRHQQIWAVAETGIGRQADAPEPNRPIPS